MRHEHPARRPVPIATHRATFAIAASLLAAGTASAHDCGSYVTLNNLDIAASAQAFLPPILLRHNETEITCPGTPNTPAVAPGGLSELRSIPSHLSDCELPFERLVQRADCHSNDRQRCEEYDANSFSEVVELTETLPTGTRYCTATLIAPQWFLTAAHCFQEEPAPGTDVRLGAQALHRFKVRAANAVLLADADRDRPLSEAIVFKGYLGHAGSYAGDLALGYLETPFPDAKVGHAHLARSRDPTATIAGYGYSNLDRGRSVGKFLVTWPSELRPNKTTLVFNPQLPTAFHSSFCDGDSGGPAFVGRARGCSSERPRSIQAIISRYDKTASGVAACLGATEMTLTDITQADLHDWICAQTNHAAGGC